MSTAAPPREETRPAARTDTRTDTRTDATPSPPAHHPQPHEHHGPAPGETRPGVRQPTGRRRPTGRRGSPGKRELPPGVKQGWHPTRRRREAQRRRRQRIAKVAVAVVLTGVATLALVRALAPTPSELPELLTPADLQSIAAVSRTDRMGTLFKATLVTAPAPERHGEFTASMWALASRAGSAGYETVLVTGPDGSTLVSGPVTDPWIAPPGHRGT